jgi:hypothetical protein
MADVPLLLALLLALVRDLVDLIAENLVLRHQLSCLVNGRSIVCSGLGSPDSGRGGARSCSS